MARASRNSKLETRTSRNKLEIGKRHWQPIGKALAIGYRKGADGGTWYKRTALTGNKYAVESIGIADDTRDADGVTVLDYFQAQGRARHMAHQQVTVKTRYKMRDAVADYLQWFAVNSKSLAITETVINAHIIPAFGDRLITSIETKEITDWRDDLVRAPIRRRSKKPVEGAVVVAKTEAVDLDDPDVLRRRRSTANRVLTIFKAILNKAWRDGIVHSDEAWRRVSSFENADGSRKVFLSDEQCARLINTTSGKFRDLIQAALLTGARYGELAHARVRDFDPDGGIVTFHISKTKAHDTFLTDEAVKFFESITAGRHADEYLLTKDDCTPWGTNHHIKPFNAASKRAKLPHATTFYALRHTYISTALKHGINLKAVADSCGTSVRMVEKNYAKFTNTDRRAMFNVLPAHGVKTSNVKALKVAK